MVIDYTIKLKFENILTSDNLQNVITRPTRVSASPSTLIDLFITNVDVSNVSFGVLSSDASDHLTIFIELYLRNSSCPSTNLGALNNTPNF